MSEITIVLEDSTYAHGFSEQYQIHGADREKAESLIKKQLCSCDEKEEDEHLMLSHPYNTIGVFGDRGSGKTSFLVSLLQECEKNMHDVKVLRIVDPTLVEHKKPLVLHVIAMINELVTAKLKEGECSVYSDAFNNRKQWEKRVRDLSVGMFAIDEVGKGYDDALWQDEEYVMHTGLEKVNQSNNFEEAIRRMIDQALTILDKKAFLLAFDDIDMDVEQGWSVMEHLRRYLSYRKLITIVSGNIKLYGTLVRQKLTDNLKLHDVGSRQMLVNELESQYMLKLINPSNRINLSPMAVVMKNDEVNVVSDSGVIKTIDKAYDDILQKCGIVGASPIKTFTDFFYSMSLRSQIHFLKDATVGEQDRRLPMGVFTSRLYEAGIDVNWLVDSPQYTNISIMSYLQKTGNHTDGYLLLPTMPDKDINCNFVGLTILACNWFKQSPQGIFDYMLRIGYFRNLVLPMTDKHKAESMYSYGGWNQLMSLKNNMGLSMAYMLGTQTSNMNEHIPLSGLETVAKKKVDNAIDEILKHEKDGKVKLLAMFPFVRLKHNRKNVGENYYSLFILLSVIDDLLGCETHDEMTARINDLKLFRSYQMPLEGETAGESSEISGEDYGIDIEQEVMEQQADRMLEWKKQYLNDKCFIPPYVIGRIMTRVFTAVGNVKGDSVGDVMNLMVCNLFNASLIEESRVKDNAKDSGSQELLNNNNLETSTKVLSDNLGKGNVVEKLSFSKWLMACPMLNCFLDEATLNVMPDSCKTDVDSKVYSLLKNITLKGGNTVRSKYSFSGGEKKWRNTVKVLHDHGVTDDDIIKHIIKPDIDEAKDYIKQLDIFDIVTEKSVKGFKRYFQSNEMKDPIV